MLPMTKRKETLRGGEIVSRMLAAEGVTHVFGIIDGTYFGFYSTLGANGIRLITPRHETSAAHMAGAYARLTGKLGVCMASNGPGVASVLPGVAVEQAEGNRVLLITSSRREGIIYPDRGGTYQYFPHVEVTRPMTKWSCAVPSVDRVAEVMRRALRLSWNGRPGVVHVDVPESIMNGTFDLDPAWLREPRQYRAMDAIAPAPAQVEAAARMLAEARHPLLHVGSGVVHAKAYAQVRALAEVLEAPVTTSWAARCVLDERSPFAVPMIYVDAVNQARTGADVVLVVGSRLGETDWWGKAPYWGSPETLKTIQVDIDLEVIGQNRPVDLAVQADAKAFLEALLERLRRQRPSMDLVSRRARLASVRQRIRERRAELDRHLADEGAPMHPAQVAHVCQRVFEEDAIVVVDGGNTAIWANFFHEVREPGAILGTPKMGMLGAGVAQALGAKAAHPERQVYCVIGDGAMGYHPQEIETAVRNGLPVVYIVLCDRQWGMVKMNQSFALRPLKTLVFKSLAPEETINADFGETEFDTVARAMGAHGERVRDPRGLEEALRRAIASGRPAVVHVDVDPVKHMWAPDLKTFKDMHQEPGE
jgi:acetolactate synthase-1/2/3 large subunit